MPETWKGTSVVELYSLFEFFSIVMEYDGRYTFKYLLNQQTFIVLAYKNTVPERAAEVVNSWDEIKTMLNSHFDSYQTNHPRSFLQDYEPFQQKCLQPLINKISL